jgi:hypothetical protein
MTGSAPASEASVAPRWMRLHRSVETAHQEHDVDVGSEHLLDIAQRRPPSQQRRAGEHRDGTAIEQRDPVADRGLRIETHAERRGDDAIGSRHDERDTVVANHASGNRVAWHLAQQLGPVGVPPEGGERVVGHRAQVVALPLPLCGTTVRARMPSVARSASSEMIGKIAAFFHSGSMFDQS